MFPPYSFIRPFLFKMDPEKAHHFTFNALQRANRLGLLDKFITEPVYDPVTVMGIDFPNRVGLAAGLDKEAKYISELGMLGFGFLEVGTVTPLGQPGNPTPRLFRLPKSKALINRLGFNNQGLEVLLNNIRASSYGGVLGINIGKNAATPVERANDDYLKCLEAVYPLADYITVNISSPNTKNLRDLQAGDALDSLLECLKNRQMELAEEHGRYKPMALKIAPDLELDQIEGIAQRLIHYKFDAVIATNTTIDKSTVAQQPHGQEQGGLSGRPVFEKSNLVISTLHQHLGEAIPIIGVGGIMNGEDAVMKIRAGAKLVQIYTGLIYEGPDLITECAATIAENCSRKAELRHTARLASRRKS